MAGLESFTLYASVGGGHGLTYDIRCVLVLTLAHSVINA